MFCQSFNCFSAKFIKVSFFCSDCKTQIEEKIEEIPYPKFDAENDTDSITSSDDGMVCPKCRKEYFYEIYCGMYSGGYFQSDEIPENAELIEN